MDRRTVDGITVRPIGVVHSPHAQTEGTPMQSVRAASSGGTIEVFPQFRDGLKDLEGFSHLLVLFFFHRAGRSALLVKPYLDDVYRGVFATRAPTRPNPIGLSVVELRSVRRGTLHVKYLDMLDGTPVLDIKPYIPEVDAWQVASIGWLEDKITEMHDSPDNRPLEDA